jgi:hypothetical protein
MLTLNLRLAQRLLPIRQLRVVRAKSNQNQKASTRRIIMAEMFPPIGKGKKGMKADSARKTKEAQAINMGKVKAKKAANAASKRMTAQAKSYPPKKKAASSYALGLTKSAKNKVEKKKP